MNPHPVTVYMVEHEQKLSLLLALTRHTLSCLAEDHDFSVAVPLNFSKLPPEAEGVVCRIMTTEAFKYRDSEAEYAALKQDFENLSSIIPVHFDLQTRMNILGGRLLNAYVGNAPWAAMHWPRLENIHLVCQPNERQIAETLRHELCLFNQATFKLAKLGVV